MDEELDDLRRVVRDLVGAWDFTPRCDAWMRGYDPAFSAELARRGLIGMTWPKEAGGSGRSNVARLVVTEELLRAGAPVAAHWIADRQIGPAILRNGSPALRAEILPGIAAGQLTFCLGMSEPDSGSDLASVRTRAVRDVDRDGWRLTGRKIWTTLAHRATHAYVLARTGSDTGEAGKADRGDKTDKHDGLTEFVVDMSAPGVSVRPLEDLGGEHHFNEVTFDDVFVPAGRVIGAEGAGWKQVTEQLSFERGGMERVLSTYPLFARFAGRDLDAAGRAAAGMLLTIVSRQPPEPARDEIGRMADEVLAAHAADVWDTITGLGWTSVGVTESDGGSGGTFADLAALVRATGRHACAVPLAEAALARSLGAAPAFAAVARDFAVADGRVSAAADVPETELPGQVVLLTDGHAACVATANMSAKRWLDLAGRPQLRVECRGAPAELLAVPPGFDPVARLTVLRLHAALGAVEGACRLTREHVTVREQFGRPLSRFQAVAHRLAEMDCARALFEVAVSAAVGLEPARVAAAAALADPVLTTVARLAHQLHGAMGITRESPLHQYTTLLWSLRDEIGPARQWALRLHELAGGDEETLWALVTTRPRGR